MQSRLSCYFPKVAMKSSVFVKIFKLEFSMEIRPADPLGTENDSSLVPSICPFAWMCQELSPLLTLETTESIKIKLIKKNKVILLGRYEM